MNIGFITARILQSPIRFFNRRHFVTEIQVDFPQTKNYCAKAIVLADGKTGKNLFELYRKGDYILIEGEYLILEGKEQSPSLIIYVFGIQPAHLIIQE